MKHQRFLILSLAVILGSTLVSSAYAECYGDAAEAYGCGTQGATGPKKASRPPASLESFGSNDGPVLPNLGYNQDSESDDVITPEERRQMMRSIVLGRTGSSTSQADHQRAINSSARPLRRSGSMPVRTR
jgi:hypothetical protein